MKKIETALVIFFLTAASVHAQFRLAIVGGGQQSKVLEQSTSPSWDSVKNNYSYRTGFHFGVLADVHFSPHSVFYFQPGLNFSNKGRRFSAVYDTTLSNMSSKICQQYINYMDIPINLLIKLKLGKNTRLVLGGGPYVSFFYNGKEKSEILYKNGSFYSQEKTNLETGSDPGQYKTFDYGANALFGFEFGHLIISANYSRGFSDAYREYNYSGTFRHQVISATIGVMMGNLKKSLASKPKDKDEDGVSDKEDKCPSEKGTIATSGCPDTDADGVADKDDKCPTIAGVIRYNGCPVPDTDKDGVNDEEDKCPAAAGIKKYNGCPIPDTDKDGVNDEEDKCPTVKGSIANMGCPEKAQPAIQKPKEKEKNKTKEPVKVIKETAKEITREPEQKEIKKEIVQQVQYAAKRLQFEFQSDKPLKSSLQILDEVAEILKSNPGLVLSIEGHTSNNGIFEQNMKLSQARADNVKKYLESKGIESSRLKAIGYGPTKPLNNGKTPEEQALNRRVELKLSVRK